jgi:carnitine monooxygenase subunit
VSWIRARHPDRKGRLESDDLFEGLADDFANRVWDRDVLGAEQTDDTRLNRQLATDTFVETYHFKRRRENTLANDWHRDALSYRLYQRNHRMIRCRQGVDPLRGQPESVWHISHGGFPVYFLLPNVVIDVGCKSIAVVRVYPDPKDPGRSISQFGFCFDAHPITGSRQAVRECSEGFNRLVTAEDYAVCESTQRALAAGLQDRLLFGRHELPLHHYHQTFRAALGMPPLECVADLQSLD